MLTLVHSLNQDQSNTYRGAMIEHSTTTFITPKINHEETYATYTTMDVINVLGPHQIQTIFMTAIRPMNDGYLLLTVNHKTRSIGQRKNYQLTPQDQQIEDQFVQKIQQQVPKDLVKSQLHGTKVPCL